MPYLIGPIIMLLTACVFASGIMLAVTGPSYGPPSGWLVVHRISFFARLFFIAIHVLAYVPRLPRLLAAEARGAALPEGETGGHAARLWLLNGRRIVFGLKSGDEYLSAIAQAQSVIGLASGQHCACDFCGGDRFIEIGYLSCRLESGPE